MFVQRDENLKEPEDEEGAELSRFRKCKCHPEMLIIKKLPNKLLSLFAALCFMGKHAHWWVTCGRN